MAINKRPRSQGNEKEKEKNPSAICSFLIQTLNLFFFFSFVSFALHILPLLSTPFTHLLLIAELWVGALARSPISVLPLSSSFSSLYTSFWLGVLVYLTVPDWQRWLAKGTKKTRDKSKKTKQNKTKQIVMRSGLSTISKTSWISSPTSSLF